VTNNQYTIKGLAHRIKRN